MRIIQLKPSGAGRYDNVSPFIITDNRLELQIILPNFNGEFYFVYEINGETFKRLLPRSGQIILENLSAGEMNAEVKHCLKGEIIKTYKVEPLLLKEIDGTLSALPEIEELRRNIVAVGREFEEYKVAAEKRVKQSREKFISLIKVTWLLYSTNIYLDQLTFEEFINRYGFKLTDEEIKLIKGDNENDET